MLTTPRILKILAAVGTSIVIPVILTVAFVDIKFDHIKAFFEQQVALTVWIYVAAIVAVMALAIFLNDRTYRRDLKFEKRNGEIAIEVEKRNGEVAVNIEKLNGEIAKRDEDIRRLNQTLVALQGLLDDANQMRFLDYVTGVPNEAKWKIDIARLSPTMADRGGQCHIALIDLVAFGELNDEFGYAKVDEILKYLANALDDSMRKNEWLYRKQAEDGGLRPDPLYRKYPGGDEFYIVIESSEADMLGLLVRLQQLMAGKIEDYIFKNIAGRKIPLLFSGAVCRLYPNQTPAQVNDRLIAALKTARYKDSPTRLKWSDKTSADFAPDTIEHRLYKQAETEFANPQQKKVNA